PTAMSVLTTSIEHPIVVTPWLHFKTLIYNFLKVTILERVVLNPLSPLNSLVILLIYRAVSLFVSSDTPPVVSFYFML
ncbi:MAG: hypothetical protein MR865_05210, partial [Bacteroidales bacterium]|nr:hypothetical protein [Bacteroidales bacterium]